MKLWQQFSRWMATSVDGGSLAAMRFFVGLVTALEAYSLIRDHGGLTVLRAAYTGDWVRYRFTYPGLAWIEPLDDRWMSLLVLVMGVAGACVAVGFVYRASIVVALVLRTYVFLLDAAHFNNHYYLECLLLLLLCFTPADRCWSVDAWWRASQAGASNAPSRLVPFWSVFVFRAQVFILYFYGALAKFNEPYLYAAQPMRAVASSPTVLAPYESYLAPETIVQLREWLAWPQTAFFLSYAGLAYDLTVGFLLLFRRTRFLGFALTLAFHALNHFLFFDDIGWFPLLGVAAALIFFAPDWPTRLIAVLRRPKWPRPDWAWLVAGAVAVPALGAALGWQPKPSGIRPAVDPPPRRWLVPLLLCLWIAFQAIWPLRHFAIAGPVIWTQEGALFSWRMKQSLKLIEFPHFRIDDPIMQTEGPDGRSEVDWNAYPGRPSVVYEDVDPDTINWREMPSVFVEYVPLYGERLLINPYAGGQDQPLSVVDLGNRAKKIWNDTFGRIPHDSMLVQTDSPQVVLDFMHRSLAERGAPPWMLETARRAQQRFSELGKLRPGSIERQQLYDQYRNDLRVLTMHPQHGPLMRELMARAHPLSLWGAAEIEAPFVRMDDREVLTGSSDGFVRADHAKLTPLLLEAHPIYVPIEQLYVSDWAGLPRVVVERDATNRVSFLWNPYAELTEWQASTMIRNPLMLYEYAQHVAEEWETEFGQRPGVYIDSRVALPPEPWRRSIDPFVDLAKSPRYYLRHNAWITMPDDPIANEEPATGAPPVEANGP